MYFDKVLKDLATGEALCRVSSTLFLRADGGCGSFGTPPAASPPTADGEVKFADQLQTAVNAALLYRLNGDRNPIHADPEAAVRVGFSWPILHGLCTYGIAGYLLTRTVCDDDPARLRSLSVRVSSPVYPGETIRIEGRRSARAVHFEAVVPERNQVVLSQGYARIT